jgi:hypothetical protein
VLGDRPGLLPLVSRSAAGETQLNLVSDRVRHGTPGSGAELYDTGHAVSDGEAPLNRVAIEEGAPLTGTTGGQESAKDG